ncbi:hypothetical protein GCM10027022_04190 [Alpinimonas psychrophila]
MVMLMGIALRNGYWDMSRVTGFRHRDQEIFGANGCRKINPSRIGGQIHRRRNARQLGQTLFDA